MAKKPPKPPSSKPAKPKGTATAKRPGKGARAIGRPHMCLPRVIEAFCAAINLGATVEDAAGYAGVTRHAVHGWDARAREAVEKAGLDPDEPPDDAASKVEEKERPFVDFFIRSTRARTGGNVAMLAVIQRAAKGGAVWEADPNNPGKQIQTGFVQPDWKAAAHRLSIRDSEYTKHARLDHQVTATGEPFGVQIYLPSEDDGGRPKGDK